MAGLENKNAFGVVRCFAALPANRNGSSLILKAPFSIDNSNKSNAFLLAWWQS